MALVSPGLQLTVTDQSQYVSAAVGTVPLVVLATAENKVVNGTIASGTTSANAGALQVFGSQRELITALGYPDFKQSSAGTPLHGNELNEYGLMSAYSALGLGNQVYAVRADIDLNQLSGTSIRPTGAVPDSTYWLDLANTTWGIYEWSADSQTFTQKTPILITANADVVSSNFTALTSSTEVLLSNIAAPSNTIGQIGSYAVVTTTVDNRIFYKGTTNEWLLVGSKEWQENRPTVVSANTNPVITGSVLSINGTSIPVTVPSGWGSVDTVVANIASTFTASDGVTAANIGGKLAIYADSNAASYTGAITITGGAGSIIGDLGIAAGTYRAPTIQYGSYAEVPAWDSSSTLTSRPNGSVWFKTGATGGGSNFVFRQYNSLTDTWTSQASSIFDNEATAVNNLDIGGGSNIEDGTIVVSFDVNTIDAKTTDLGIGSYYPSVKRGTGAVKTVAEVVADGDVDTGIFLLLATQPGSQGTLGGFEQYQVDVTTGTRAGFVEAILAADIPNVTAGIESNGAISITHQAGGIIVLRRGEWITGELENNVPFTAGFTYNSSANCKVPAVASGAQVDANATVRILSPFDTLGYTFSITTPTADPVDGTLWYNSDATTIDIMVNDGNGAWRGYQNLTADARGYNLSNTDDNGVIVSASRPTSQSDRSALVAGDLWLDTSDLENWPKLSRYNGSTWIAIDNTDQISQNGIVFADARWDSTGTTDPIVDNEPAISALLTSDYTDADCPDARLYPRGIMLVNTRRSGYNVKRYVNNYYTVDQFDSWSVSTTYQAGAKVTYGTDAYVALASVTGEAPNASDNWELLVTNAWVTASGNKANGSMYAGRQAQRRMVVAAMQAAIDSNTQIREDQFVFNLIAAPGYPELIDNMVALNNDRANTAFVIGDTPMTLSTNVVEITNWSNGVTEGGLTTADPYLGVYYPSGLSNDLSGNSIMVPPSHMALRTFIYSDNVSFPWFAPAGTRRGLVDNANDLGYLNAFTGEFVRTGINQALRDSLYSININPVTIMTGTGIVVWGQKTRNPSTSAMDRINVARLVNYIRTILAKSGNAFLFEPNDKLTRDQFKQIIESAMNDLVAKRGIYDYLVVCDTSNNTPDRIARNELYVDIAIEPMKDVEFIYIPIRLLNPGSIGSLGK